MRKHRNPEPSEIVPVLVYWCKECPEDEQIASPETMTQEEIIEHGKETPHQLFEGALWFEPGKTRCCNCVAGVTISGGECLCDCHVQRKRLLRSTSQGQEVQHD